MLVAVLLITLTYSGAHANRKSTPALPINHCYHWLNERTNKYLTYKYQYASKNKGELTFYTTPSTSNGSVAGPGLYCAKTPIDSLSYGDRIIRIEFVDDVVFKTETGAKICGTNGRFYPNQSDCNSKTEDVHLYSKSPEWYVIKNPNAVKSWTANDTVLINELTDAKNDGDNAADSHIDLTLQAIQAEIKQLNKQTIINTNARMSILEILNNPTQRNKTPPLSLIAIISTLPAETQKNLDVPNLLQTEFSRALSDTLLTSADFQSTLTSLSSDSRVKIALEESIKKIDFNNLNKYNVAVLLTKFDQLNIKLSEQQIQKLWKESISSIASLSSIHSTGLNINGDIRRLFYNSLPQPSDLARDITDANISEILKIMNDFIDTKGPSVGEYTRLLLEKLISGQKSETIVEVFDSIKNPALEKEKALAEIVRESDKTNFKGMDPIYMGALLEHTLTNISITESNKLKDNILKLPLKVTSRLTYLYLEDLKQNKIKLPQFYPYQVYLIRLAQRSIAERNLGKNTTNTFRFILSGTFHFFNEQLKKNPTSQTKIFQEAGDFFISLAKELIKSDDKSYSYISLQNAGFYIGSMKYNLHAIENLISNYQEGDNEYDSLIEYAIPRSIDASAFNFLSRNSNNKKIKKLLNLALQYLSSNEFNQYLSSNEFSIAQNEKRNWLNITRNPELCRANDCKKNDRIPSDICYFIDMFEQERNSVESIGFSMEYQNADRALKAAQTLNCKSK